jgi:phosphatidylglycerophosphatase A
MASHPAHWLSLGFGSGLSPVAPGTAGTLWAWAAYALLNLWLTPAQMGGLILLTTLLGWWSCTVTTRDLQMPDPGNIVVDEVVAFWLVLWWLSPCDLGWQLAAFVLFRFFDAVKPGPVGWADRQFHDCGFGWKGSFGIMLDDLVAALCTLLVLAIGRYFA